jgi:hypothetical protein
MNADPAALTARTDRRLSPPVRLLDLILCPLGDAESSRKLHAAKLPVQFERRTEASVQARLLRPDCRAQELARSRAQKSELQKKAGLLNWADQCGIGGAM